MSRRRNARNSPAWLPPFNTAETSPEYYEPVTPGVVSTLLHIQRPPIGRELSFKTTWGDRPRSRYPRIAPDSSVEENDEDKDKDEDEFDVEPTPTPTPYVRDGVDEDFGLNGESTRPEDNEKKKGIFARKVRRVEIVQHVEVLEIRKKFIRMLAKALMTFGAPSHRIESQLDAAAKILVVNAAFVHLPAVIIISFGDKGTKTSEMHFVRAGGRIALSMLHKVHSIYRDVLHDRMGAEDGMNALAALMLRPPVYNIWFRCILSFFCSSIICTLAFGGSLLDMFIGGGFACVLQYLGLNAASRSSIYANVYEISAAIIVSFTARVLSTLPGGLFCYNAIASAGVTLILPGFTVLISSLELTSRNVMCGSVRMIYAVIYTFFLGFGLTIGSDIYLVFNKKAAGRMEELTNPIADRQILVGNFTMLNGTNPGAVLNLTLSIASSKTRDTLHMIKGCYRDPEWLWWRQPFPLWTMVFLVPLYSFCSSLANLQRFKSWQMPVMVSFSCCAYAANKSAGLWITDRVYIVSGLGALVVGLCGNIYSRVAHGTAFTSMVTGVLFLVPSALSLNGGLIQPYNVSAGAGEQYLGSFSLGLRMVQVAIGITIGLFISQITVYSFGRKKNAAHFAF